MSLPEVLTKALNEIASVILVPWIAPVHGYRTMWAPATQDFYPLADQSGVRMSVNAKTGFISIRGRNLRKVGESGDWTYFHVDGDPKDWFDVDIGKR